VGISEAESLLPPLNAPAQASALFRSYVTLLILQVLVFVKTVKGVATAKLKELNESIIPVKARGKSIFDILCLDLSIERHLTKAIFRPYFQAIFSGDCFKTLF
jgi:hypothetical protein